MYTKTKSQRQQILAGDKAFFLLFSSEIFKVFSLWAGCFQSSQSRNILQPENAMSGICFSTLNASITGSSRFEAFE
jgi:hypothetical protein